MRHRKNVLLSLYVLFTWFFLGFSIRALINGLIAGRLGWDHGSRASRGDRTAREYRKLRWCKWSVLRRGAKTCSAEAFSILFLPRNCQEPDESLGERLWGLTEMLPETIRNVCGVATDFSVNTTKNLYTFSCSASWIFFTSSMILFAPVLFETERAQMEELQRSQQKQASHCSGLSADFATNNTLDPAGASRSRLCHRSRRGSRNARIATSFPINLRLALLEWSQNTNQMENSWQNTMYSVHFRAIKILN